MELRCLLTTFTVRTTADAGPNSLREAIVLANGCPGADNIDFSIPTSTSPGLDVPVPGFDPITQTWRITPITSLPAITDPLTIDGYSQAQFPVPFRYPQQAGPDPVVFASTPNTLAAKDGNNAVIRMIIDGSLSGGATGFDVDASHTIIRGLIIDGFGVGVSVVDPIVPVSGPGVVGTLIQGNFIGRHYLFLVDPATGEPLPPASRAIFAGRGNTLQGVLLGSTNATVGGTRPQENNVIVGNGLQGVSILQGAEGNQVIGNQIGIAGPSLNGLFAVAPNGLEGVLIASSSNYVGGTAPGSGNLISGNGSHGVGIVGPEATENQVKGNYIGVGPGGGYLFGTGDPGNFGDGVRIDNAGSNLVGGPSANDRNVISANEGAGVRISGFFAVKNVVRGNYVGITADGRSALGNSQEGVAITPAAPVVGPLDPTIQTQVNIVGPGNVISANLRGVLLSDPRRPGTRVLDNLIGTDSAGIADLGNASEGVRIDGSSGNRITGNGAGSSVITGNDVGVLTIGPLAYGNEILGNFIGTDVTGTFPLGNSREGVRIENAPRNTIGGTTASVRNLISANHWGVVLTSPLARENIVLGNFIGTDVTGTLPLGNELDGVRIINDASDNLIGGGSVSEGNTIAFNLRDGVRVKDNSVGNVILTNRIFANLGLGINLYVPLDPNDPAESHEPFVPFPPIDPGDSDSGPNTLQNAPVLEEIIFSATATTVRGRLNSTPNTNFTLQFFANSPPDSTGRGDGEGERYLGQATVTTGPGGVANFSVDLPAAVAADELVTATATDPLGNTSEFSYVDTEQPGTLQFLMAGFTIREDSATATIVVTRERGGGGLVAVNYATGDGTARAGLDYLPTSGTLEFNPGETIRTFTITILLDPSAEEEETVILSLFGPTGGATLGSPSTATLVIRDDTADREGPRVRSVRAISGRFGIAAVVVTFDEPLDPARAVDLVNYGYSVRIAGRDGRLGTRDDLLIGLCPAAYDPATLTVTLPLARAIAKRMRLRLLINQATDVAGAGVGVADLAGNLLDGDANGRPGGPFSAVVVARPRPEAPGRPVAGPIASPVASRSPRIRPARGPSAHRRSDRP